MSKETKNEILSMTSGLTEAALDSMLTDGLFKEIPIFGTLVSVKILILNISNIFLLKKIVSFINALHIKTQKDIDTFKQKYFEDKDYKTIGSKILFVLEKIDDEKKVVWLAKAFLIYLDKKINQNQFIRLSSIINISYVSDVERIIIFNEKQKITSVNELVDDYVLDHLYSIGLVSNIGFDGGDVEGNNSGNIYRLNEFGNIFLNEII